MLEVLDRVDSKRCVELYRRLIIDDQDRHLLRLLQIWERLRQRAGCFPAAVPCEERCARISPFQACGLAPRKRCRPEPKRTDSIRCSGSCGAPFGRDATNVSDVARLAYGYIRSSIAQDVRIGVAPRASAAGSGVPSAGLPLCRLPPSPPPSARSQPSHRRHLPARPRRHNIEKQSGDLTVKEVGDVVDRRERTSSAALPSRRTITSFIIGHPSVLDAPNRRNLSAVRHPPSVQRSMPLGR